MAIAHDATTPNINSANSTGESFAHTCTGSDLTLVAIVLLFGVASNGVSAITYNGVSMGTAKASREYNYTINRYLTALIFTLDGPAAGSNTFAVTFNGTAAANAIILTSYAGANNGVGANTGGADGTDDTPTASFDTDASGGLIVAGATMLGADTDPFTPGADVTERSDGDTGGGSANTDIGFTTGDKAASGGSDTIAFTAAVADFWTIVAIELNEATGGGVTIAGQDVTQLQTVESGAISQTHVVSAVDLAQAQTVDPGSISQTHIIGAVDLSQAQTVENGPISSDLAIGGVDLSHAQSVESGAISQQHSVAGTDCSLGQTVDAGSITQTHIVTGLDIYQVQRVEVGTIPSGDSVVLLITLAGLFDDTKSLTGLFGDDVTLAGLFNDEISLQGEL